MVCPADSDGAQRFFGDGGDSESTKALREASEAAAKRQRLARDASNITMYEYYKHQYMMLTSFRDAVHKTVCDDQLTDKEKIDELLRIIISHNTSEIHSEPAPPDKASE